MLNSDSEPFVPSPVYAAYLACREAQRSGDMQRIRDTEVHYNRVWFEWHQNGHKKTSEGGTSGY